MYLGRKDPMLPGNGIGDTDKTCYPGSPEYKFKYGSEGLNTTDIKEYIRNPHKFNIKEEMDGKYYNLWSTDNDKTDANDEVVIKSVYDPSPVGYSLPASNAFTGFTTTGGNVGAAHTPLTPEQRAQLNVKGNFDKGWDFYTKPDKQHTTFFQASGYRNHSSGSLLSVFIYGYYLTSGSFEHIREWILHFDSGFVFPLNYDHQHSFGFPVRSAEEKKWKMMCVGGSCNTKPEMDGRYYNLWSTDNDKTDANDEVVIKTVYDPSPVGYSLPASNAFTGFTTTGGHTNNPAEYNVKGKFDKGWHFYTKPSKQGIPFFFPAWGYRNYNSGLLGNVSSYGFDWVAGPGNTNFGRYLSFYSGDVSPLHYSHRSYGFEVRSAEEKVLKYELDEIANSV